MKFSRLARVVAPALAFAIATPSYARLAEDLKPPTEHVSSSGDRMVEAQIQDLVEKRQAKELLVKVNDFLRLPAAEKTKDTADNLLQQLVRAEILLTKRGSMDNDLRAQIAGAKRELEPLLVEKPTVQDTAAVGIADVVPLKTLVRVYPPTISRQSLRSNSEVFFTGVDAPAVVIDKMSGDQRGNAKTIYTGYGDAYGGKTSWSSYWDKANSGLSTEAQKNMWLGPNATLEDFNTFSNLVKSGKTAEAQQFAKEHGYGNGAGLSLLAAAALNTKVKEMNVKRAYSLDFDLASSVYESDDAFRSNWAFARAKLGFKSSLVWTKGNEREKTFVLDSEGNLREESNTTGTFSKRYSYYDFNSEIAVNLFAQTFRPAAHFYVSEDKNLFFGGFSLTMGDPKNPVFGHLQEVKFARERALNLGPTTVEPGLYQNSLSATIAIPFNEHHALVLLPGLDISDTAKVGGSGSIFYKYSHGNFSLEPMVGAGRVPGGGADPYFNAGLGIMDSFYVNVAFALPKPDDRVMTTFVFRPLKFLERLGVLPEKYFGTP